MTAERFARIVAVISAVFWLGTGLWAFFAPQTFFENVATFEPYNEHFIHDLGAFSLGLGAVFVLALLRLPSLATALGGGAVAALFHEFAHIIDSDKGGKETDPIGLGIFAVLAIAAAAAAWPKPTTTSDDRDERTKANAG